MTSELYSASELSSYTFFTHHSGDGRHRNHRPNQACKRGLDISEEETIDLTPSKRAASCRPDDLSCQEATLFGRLPDSSCTLAFEAESRLKKAASKRCVSYMASAPCNMDMKAMLRTAYLKESVDCPRPDYMERHGPAAQASQFLEPGMRTVAVSWLVEVACEFSLQQETLFFAADLLDRFLSHAKAVPRNHLQLTAVACMMVAAKHEETNRIPTVRELTNIADHCFQTTDLLRMESLILHTVRFRIMRPNSYTINCLLQRALSLSPREAALATYLTELSILDYSLLRFLPSRIAASAMLLAQADRGTPEAVAALEQTAGYPAAALQECALELRSLQQRAFDALDVYNPLMAVKEKYRDVHWHCVSHETPIEPAAVAALAASTSRAVDAPI